MSYRVILGLGLPLIFLAAGCSPASTVAKIGMYAVGKVVDDAEVDKLAQELIGQPPSAADARLGARIDTWQDVNSPRRWMVYPEKLDPLKMHHIVVEEDGRRIVALEKVHTGTGEADIALKLIDEAKVKGRAPRQCQQALGGEPLLSVRSGNTGHLTQLYNGSLIEGLGDQKYCVLRFGGNGLCEKVEIVDVSASAGRSSIG